MNSAVRLGRVAIAIAVGGAMALGAAGIAAAEPAAGIAERSDTKFEFYNDNGAKHLESLMTLTLDGGSEKVAAYCIDHDHLLDAGKPYTETGWAESTVKNLDKVQWILAHSTPNVSDAQVLRDAGIERPDVDDAKLHKLVYGGTQTAIWHFSDGFKLGGQTDDTIKAVYRYLVDHATKEDEPRSVLKIEPEHKSGEAGERVGPYTVVSSGEVTLSAEGGKLVKADGTQLTGKVPNGTKFYAVRDKAGDVRINASSDGKNVPYGRVFVARSDANAHQKIILGGFASTPMSADAKATFKAVEATPSPTPSHSSSPVPSASPTPSSPALPVTGASATSAVVVGLVLLLGGGLLVMALRRRKIRFTA